MEKSEIAIVIQAGGRSSRMGQNKALMELSGKPVIERTLERIITLGSQAFVVTDDLQAYAFLANAKPILDMFPGRGPLGGIVTAFESVAAPYVLICACDMPFASPDLFQAELDFLAQEDHDVVIPQVNQRLEPLHAVYRRASCLPPARRILEQGRGKIIDWFPGVKVKILEESFIHRFDPSGQAFFNINTPEDYADAQSIYMEHARKSKT